ncbi:MAG: GNAT family N-acetyltransferase [Pararhodobacter sp.]|nr:GNAT family N-acetyltransferase [Pararhodobacter sp.]
MLRPASSDDLPAVLAIWTRPETAMLLPPPEPGDAEAACDDGLLFVWERKGRVAGFANLAVWHRADGIWGLTHFAVANPGQGEGRRFLTALLDEVFEQRGAHRLSVDSVPDNRPALRLWEWAGFRPEGCFRQCWRRPDGRWSDSLLFALLATERPRAEALD